MFCHQHKGWRKKGGLCSTDGPEALELHKRQLDEAEDQTRAKKAKREAEAQGYAVWRSAQAAKKEAAKEARDAGENVFYSPGGGLKYHTKVQGSQGGGKKGRDREKGGGYRGERWEIFNHYSSFNAWCLSRCGFLPTPTTPTHLLLPKTGCYGLRNTHGYAGTSRGEATSPMRGLTPCKLCLGGNLTTPDGEPHQAGEAWAGEYRQRSSFGYGGGGGYGQGFSAYGW